jgi:outer membrane protein assembly factor BamB
VTLRPSTIALASMLVLSGCGTWLGESEEPRLPGERVSVMLLEEGPRADERLASLSVVLPPPRPNEDWPQSGGTPSHAPGHLAVADTIERAWSASIGAGSSGRERLLASPIVAQGRVFTIDSEGSISAFAASDGSRAWTAEPEELEPVDRLGGGGIAWIDGKLVAAFSHGDVVALDAGSGAELWRQRLRAPVRTNPSAADGKVFVVSADNQLFTLSADTGEILWRHAGTFEQAALLGGAAPAIDGSTVVAAYSSGEVFALDVDDGRPLWGEALLRPRRTLAIGSITDIVGDPVIDRDRVIVAGNGGEMAAFDLARGARVWDVQLTSRETPWVVGDFIFALTERNEVVCVLRQGGHIRWVSPLVRPDEPASDEPQRWAGPVLAGDRLILVGSTGEVASMSPYTGELLGRADLGGSVTLPPVVAGGTVYFLTDGGELLAYR